MCLLITPTPCSRFRKQTGKCESQMWSWKLNYLWNSRSRVIKASHVLCAAQRVKVLKDHRQLKPFKYLSFAASLSTLFISQSHDPFWKSYELAKLMVEMTLLLAFFLIVSSVCDSFYKVHILVSSQLATGNDLSLL